MKKILLLEPHRHAGKDYPAGTRLDVDDATAKWLTDHKVGKIVTPGQPQTPAPVTSAEDKPNKDKVTP